MTAIIVDDEPLAREAIQSLCSRILDLEILEVFGSAIPAAGFVKENQVDLIFLDIQMPGVNGLEFAKTIPAKTLVIFTTAYSEYALDGFELDAIDYLVKPIKPERFSKAVKKAFSYHSLLGNKIAEAGIAHTGDDYFFVKSERKFIKIHFKDILFVEGLKDYVVMQTEDQRVITAMNIKTIHEQMPSDIFARTSKSHIINVKQIDSFDNNNVVIGKYEIPIGNAYRSNFFDNYVTKKLLGR